VLTVVRLRVALEPIHNAVEFLNQENLSQRALNLLYTMMHLFFFGRNHDVLLYQVRLLSEAFWLGNYSGRAQTFKRRVGGYRSAR